MFIMFTTRVLKIDFFLKRIERKKLCINMVTKFLNATSENLIVAKS